MKHSICVEIARRERAHLPVTTNTEVADYTNAGE